MGCARSASGRRRADRADRSAPRATGRRCHQEKMLRLAHHRCASTASARYASTAASGGRVSVNRSSAGIVHVKLTRPDIKMNALDIDMFRSIRDAAQSLISDSSGVKAVGGRQA